MLEILGYTLLCKNQTSKAGSGVAVYWKDGLTFKRRSDLECDSVEILSLELCPYKSKRFLLIAGCYRPPSSTKADDKFEECIETAYLSGKEIILTGDFNINLAEESSRSHALTKDLKTMHFDRLIIDETRPASGTLLDHTYRSKSIVAVVVLKYALSDQLPTFAVRKYFKQSKQEHSAIKCRNIKGVDDRAFKFTLANFP